MKIQASIDYIEFASPKFTETQIFFKKAFSWEYEKYGENYLDITNAGLGGGIENGDLKAPLIVLKCSGASLEEVLKQVQDLGAEITKEIFSFPGGRRFQFIEPGGTEMAVWEEEYNPI